MIAPAGSVFRVEQAHRTHRGAVRTVNEDASVLRPQFGLWAVADGMGGHAGGRWASRTIAEALDRVEMPDGLDGATAALGSAVDDANATIWAAAQERGAPIGSTVAMLLLHRDRFVALWAGDSRVYRCRDGALAQLTTDHSEVERLVASGLIDRQDVASHPFRNVLARSVGTAPTVALDRVQGEIRGGDLFLLCSDGLSGTIDDAEIEHILVSTPPERAVQRLLDRTLDRGAPDNVTITIVECETTTSVGALASREASAV